MKLPFLVFIRTDRRSSAVSKHYLNISNNTKNLSITGLVLCENVRINAMCDKLGPRARPIPYDCK